MPRLASWCWAGKNWRGFNHVARRRQRPLERNETCYVRMGEMPPLVGILGSASFGVVANGLLLAEPTVRRRLDEVLLTQKWASDAASPSLHVRGTMLYGIMAPLL